MRRWTLRRDWNQGLRGHRAVPVVEELESRRLLSVAGLIGLGFEAGGSLGGSVSLETTPEAAGQLGVSIGSEGRPGFALDPVGGAAGLRVAGDVNLVSPGVAANGRPALRPASLAGTPESIPAEATPSFLIVLIQIQPWVGATGAYHGGPDTHTGTTVLPPTVGSVLPGQGRPPVAVSEASPPPAVAPVVPTPTGGGENVGVSAQSSAPIPENHPTPGGRAAAGTPAAVVVEEHAVPVVTAATNPAPAGPATPAGPVTVPPAGPPIARGPKSGGGGAPEQQEWIPETAAPAAASAAPANAPAETPGPVVLREAVDAAFLSPVWEHLGGAADTVGGVLREQAGPALANPLAGAAALGMVLGASWSGQVPERDAQKRHTFRRI